MGVKKHFILTTSDAIFVGPAVHYELLRLYGIWRRDYRLPQLAEIQWPVGGWRKRVPFLYQILHAAVRDRISTLRELRARNPRKEQEYRDALGWIKNHPRPQTPPRGR
jgi:hypothetical protein